ncbi:unnamed protein product [Fusarium venenatum]|uniref:Uncharacterized protein n=1 Tax=Fusarium venenatum TaxID=56646 RepID=A0A2L2U1H4_9HYPO|nr:uncharacterized protein FVRRES_09177 [Fusarium venenatum]KAH6965876.1 hypothetical protein EDB82DRAFT_541020 [Fusarium venenatum]CEI69100.1 unnamed protein product [Fusarium venenatum]
MTSLGYETPFWADLDACERAIVDEKPSPLRVATYNENFQKDTRYLENRYKDNSVKHSKSFQEDDLLTVPKRRKVETQSGKENVRTFQHNQTLSTRSRRNMYAPGHWAQHDSPPRLLGVMPLPQLSVKKKRQAHTHARVQPDQNRSLSPFSVNTLPAAYEMRRPGKIHSPLTNLYDRDSMYRQESPLNFHATGWTGYPLPPDNNLQLPPIKSLTTLPRQRTVSCLAPKISITPEVTVIEAGHNIFWVAIEISATPWCIPENNIQPEASENQSETNGLRDLNVRILPTEKSSIIRILQEQPFPLDRLDPGPSICLLVKVRVHVVKDMQEERQECPQKEIDNLIEALEQELGDSTINYMTVRLSYRPSAFPEWQDVGNASDKMFTTKSKIETAATASVKLHNAMSLWSPAPVLKSNPLLPLIERH